MFIDFYGIFFHLSHPFMNILTEIMCFWLNMLTAFSPQEGKRNIRSHHGVKINLHFTRFLS
jgi:hypothetical protein